MYEIEADTFYYDGADLTFDKEFTTYADLLAGKNTPLLRSLAHQGYLIRVPKIYIAFQQMQDYTFYASLRDTTSYGNCRKINYDLAMQQLDGKLLDPGELYNMNREISNLPGYCDGSGEKFLFYE